MSLNNEFTDKYLDLLQFKNKHPLSLEFLGQLQSSHLQALAWNTFDVFLRRKITLDPYVILNKFLVERRGGLCYELNGAFCQLLKNLGFNAHLSSCCAIHYHDSPFDFSSDTHAVIIVHFEENQYLVEVGYGDLIKYPVKIEDQFYHRDESGEYRLSYDSNKNRYQLHKRCSKHWITQYHFELDARDLLEFNPNLQIVFQHPTYQSLNYIKPGQQGVQVIKNNQYMLYQENNVKEYSFEELGGLPSILKERLGISSDFVNTYFAAKLNS